MALDAGDLVRSVFDKVTSDIGLKLIAAFFVLQLLNIGSSYSFEVGGPAAAIGAVVSLAAAVAGILLMIGSFRALDTGELEKQQFTDNIIWPFLRLVGANILTTVFVVVALIPASLIALLTVGGAGVGVTLGSTALTVVVGLLGALLGIGSLVFVAYAVLALITALPEIAVNDSRLFEALDNSVQRSSGEKLRMFISLVPVVLLYLLVLPVSAVAAVAPEASVVVSPLIAVLSAATTVVLYTTLVEFNQRL